MNCFKSINLTRDYGNLRLGLMSTLFSLTYFIVYFMLFRMFHPETIYSQTGLLPILILVIMVIPLHSLLHCIPIWFTGKKAWIELAENRYSFFCRIPNVLPKKTALISVSFPLIVLTSLSLVGPLLYPEYLHVFAIISTVNMFYCFKDMIYIFHLWNAPKDSYLEDSATGFQIIVRRTF
ncbi:DUF3267 domain-containing protein [Pseudalkalibacillus berkeleyi]|uniref:DUF3267 domain-containing protein n=1 Tax=Pseudalkalibacillus berkeleyi TaxID=1069813 RepID=A0ABS9GX52_9BACL|nr:DUF3267 domain-containing protein [Pseudalkalibacillus berkeleyi]MCF6136175.1 DUF3267 domain-containing protein [Pseudalkalibacillus berkeleyi]